MMNEIKERLTQMDQMSSTPQQSEKFGEMSNDLAFD
jgi:hypothetical protein